jgi:hypothetical protein
MDIALLVTLIVTNLCWLYFWDRKDKRDRNERWELRERKDRPEVPKAPPSHLIEAAKKIREVPTKPDERPEPKDEFDLVGQVNPPTPLRRDE